MQLIPIIKSLISKVRVGLIPALYIVPYITLRLHTVFFLMKHWQCALQSSAELKQPERRSESKPTHVRFPATFETQPVPQE